MSVEFKKASVIASENGKASAAELKKAAPDNKDWATKYVYQTPYNNDQITFGAPTNISNYFFLSAMGYYKNGTLEELGQTGCYWSSTPLVYNPQNAYSFYFRKDNNNKVNVVVSNFHERDGGFQVWRTE